MIALYNRSIYDVSGCIKILIIINIKVNMSERRYVNWRKVKNITVIIIL